MQSPGGSFQHIQLYLKEIMVRVTSRRYFLDPTKRLLVFSENNVLWVQSLFRGMGLRVMTGRHYLGGFIGKIKADKYWPG